MPAAPPTHESINARPWRRAEAPSRVLAIRIQAMGDTVATFPYLRALRRRVPGMRLDFLTRADYADLAKGVGLADRVFTVPGGSARRQLLGAARLLPLLWARRYDVVIDLQRNRTSTFVRRSLMARAWSEFDRFSPILGGERYRLTIEAIGLGPLDVFPDIGLRDPDAGRDKLLAAGWDGTADLIVLNPGGTGDRRWPEHEYVAFARLLAAGHPGPLSFLVLGVQGVAERAAALRAALGHRVISLVGDTSLKEMLALVGRSRLMVSEDAGLLHVAWVLGVPAVGVFGASRSVWARPHGNYSRLVSACREADGVCADGRCRRGPPPCLESLPADRVYRAALAALVLPDGGKVIARGGHPMLATDVDA